MNAMGALFRSYINDSNSREILDIMQISQKMSQKFLVENWSADRILQETACMSLQIKETIGNMTNEIEKIELQEAFL